MVHQAGVPESFRVLVKEFQALGLDVSMIDENNKELDLRELEEEESKENPLLSVDEIKDEPKEVETKEIEEETEEDMEDFEPDFDDKLDEEFNDDEFNDEEFGGEE